MKELPKNIHDLLVRHDAPGLLRRHLTLVYNVGLDILDQLTLAWPDLKIEKNEVLFGTATHDIGKIVEREELHQSGHRHETAGYDFLIRQGVSENLARFARTHGNWSDDNLKMEDLIVALADKIWKGKRIDELEERLAKMISENTQANYWDVYIGLDTIISGIVIGADKRLSWQNGEE